MAVTLLAGGLQELHHESVGRGVLLHLGWLPKGSLILNDLPAVCHCVLTSVVKDRFLRELTEKGTFLSDQIFMSGDTQLVLRMNEREFF